jgi:hypothetical protein
MYRIGDHAQRSGALGTRGLMPSGLNEIRWTKTVRRHRTVDMQSAMIGMNSRLEHAWVVSVTALAGRRRTG